MRKPLGNQFALGDLKLPFREACQVDNVVYLSGQLAFTADGTLAGDDIATQTHQVIKNIEAVLQRCELTLNDVFKVTVWLVNVQDFAAFNQVFAEYFSDNLPVRSTVRSDLAAPGALVELEVQAYANKG